MKKRVMLLSIGMLCAPVLGAADQSYWEKAQNWFGLATNSVEKKTLIDVVQATGRGIQATVDSDSVAAGVDFGAKQLATVAVTAGRAVDAVASTGVGAAESAVDTFVSTVSNSVKAGQAVGRGIQATVDSDSVAAGVDFGAKQLATVAVTAGRAVDAVASTGVGAAESAVDTFVSTVSNGVKAGQAVGCGIQATVDSGSVVAGVDRAAKQFSTVAATFVTDDTIANEAAAAAAVANAVGSVGANAVEAGVGRAAKQLATVAKHQASLWGKFGGFCSNARSAFAGYATVARDGLATAASSARAFGATGFDRLQRGTRSGIAGTRTGVAAGWNRATAAVANAKTYSFAKCAQLKDVTHAGIAGAKTQMNAGWSRAATTAANAKVKAARVKNFVSEGATNAYGTMRGVAVNTAIGTKQWLRAANVPADQRTRVMATRIGGVALGAAALGYAAYKAYGLWENKQQPRVLTMKEPCKQVSEEERRALLLAEAAQAAFRGRPAKFTE